MNCNIDAKGKTVRLISGIVHCIAAIVLAAVILAGGLSGTLWWVLVAAVFAGGAFQIYEGWSGWCIVRAMGIKTPI